MLSITIEDIISSNAFQVILTLYILYRLTYYLVYLFFSNYGYVNREVKLMMDRRDARTYDFPNVPKGIERRVVDADLIEIKEMLASGDVTSEQLVSIYGSRCYRIGR